jgi:hypothetical protein
MGTTFGTMSHNDKATCLIATHTRCTQEVLDRIDDKDKHAIDDIFKMTFHCLKGDKVPSAFSDRRVMGLTMKERADEVGARLMTWWAPCVDEATGVIDWEKMPLFRAETDANGRVYKMTHMSGDVCNVADHFQVDLKWDFLDAFSDSEARWFMAPRTHYWMYDWFEAGTGPNKARLDKRGLHLEKMAAVLSARLNTQVKQLLDLTTPDMIELTARGKRLRDEALAVARATRKRNTTGTAAPRVLKSPALADAQRAAPAATATAATATATDTRGTASTENGN